VVVVVQAIHLLPIYQLQKEMVVRVEVEHITTLPLQLVMVLLEKVLEEEEVVVLMSLVQSMHQMVEMELLLLFLVALFLDQEEEELQLVVDEMEAEAVEHLVLLELVRE
jgi:hypothetical protein